MLFHVNVIFALVIGLVVVLSYHAVDANLRSSSCYAFMKSTSMSPNPLMISTTAHLKKTERRVNDHQQGTASIFPTIEEYYEDGSDEVLQTHTKQLDVSNHPKYESIELCSISSPPVITNLARGAFLRIASDLTGGTPLENIKCRVQTTGKNIFTATQDIISEPGSFLNLWSGTPSRTVEGALMGGIFLVASAATKKQVFAMGGSKTAAAFSAGIVGGVAQAFVMTPCGMVFTSLNVNKMKPGYENDNAITAAKRIIDQKGLSGLFVGGGPMALRQASNWASRSFLTELCRSSLQLSKYGIMGEIGSGVIGGLGSCWNTPIETVRVLMQRDVSCGVQPKTFGGYVQQELDSGGIPSLFKGVSPRALQSAWQTVFMVVVPTLLGL